MVFEDLLERAMVDVRAAPGYADKEALLERAFEAAKDDPFGCTCLGISMLFAFQQVLKTEQFTLPGAHIEHTSEFDSLGRRWKMTLTQVKE